MGANAIATSRRKQRIARTLGPCHDGGVKRVIVLLAALMTPVSAAAQGSFQGFALRPPCEGVPDAAYAMVGGAPIIGSWHEADPNKAPWQAAPCLRWSDGHTRMSTALAAAMRAGSLEQLLTRYGALSKYNLIRFWSVLHQNWEEFVSSAGFVDGPAARYSLPDLTAEQFVTGREFYYYEIDHSGRRSINRLTVRQRTADSVELATENITPIAVAMFTVFEPRALQSVTYIRPRGPQEWNYLATIGVGEGSDFIAVRSPSPYINRLMALYRYMAGLQTDGAPPAAPND